MSLLRGSMRARSVRPAASLRLFSASALARDVEKDITSTRLAELLTANKTSGKPLLVDFFATWCQPCKVLTPVLEKLAADPSLTEGRPFDLVTLDVDKELEAAQTYKVRTPC